MSAIELFKQLLPETFTGLERQELRERIRALEAKVRGEPQLDILTTHYFSKDVYARQILIPKGGLVVGKIHKHANMNIISKGDVSFLSIDGVERVVAPHTFVASPGAKRVIYAHEDTVWTTIHGTHLTDLDNIEAEFIAVDYDDVCETDLKILKGEVCLG